MMGYELDAKEREVARVLLDDAFYFPEGTSVPTSTLFWATKLAALVDINDVRAEYLYKVLRHCLSCEMRAKEAPIASSSEDLRVLERQKDVYEYYAVDAKLSACQAAEIVAEINGASIDMGAFDPKVKSTTCSTDDLLKAAYHALTAEIRVPGF